MEMNEMHTKYKREGKAKIWHVVVDGNHLCNSLFGHLLAKNEKKNLHVVTEISNAPARQIISSRAGNI